MKEEKKLEELRKKRAYLLESTKKVMIGYTDANLPDWALKAYDEAVEEMRVLSVQIERMETAKRIIVFRPGDTAFYKCPTCRTILSIQDKRPDIEYCWHCDQKLDWETEE